MSNQGFEDFPRVLGNVEFGSNPPTLLLRFQHLTGVCNRWMQSVLCPLCPCRVVLPVYLLKTFLICPAFFCYFAGNFFGGAFGFKIGIVGSATGGFLELAFDFVCLSFDSICSTFFIIGSPFTSLEPARHIPHRSSRAAPTLVDFWGPTCTLPQCLERSDPD